MKRSRFIEEQIIAILKEQEAGAKTVRPVLNKPLVDRQVSFERDCLSSWQGGRFVSEA